MRAPASRKRRATQTARGALWVLSARSDGSRAETGCGALRISSCPKLVFMSAVLASRPCRKSRVCHAADARTFAAVSAQMLPDCADPPPTSGTGPADGWTQAPIRARIATAGTRANRRPTRRVSALRNMTRTQAFAKYSPKAASCKYLAVGRCYDQCIRARDLSRASQPLPQ